jgi:hypothetical protein
MSDPNAVFVTWELANTPLVSGVVVWVLGGFVAGTTTVFRQC